MNLNKTVCLLLGKQQHKLIENIQGIIVTNEPVRCLGIYVGNNKYECEHLNWGNKIDQIKELLMKWVKRDLTIFGKVTLIKTLVLPKLTFLATNTTIPTGIIKEVNKLLYNFIWGKRDRIKRNLLVQDMVHGGVGMIDIEAHFQAVKSSWIGRILHTDTT